MTKREMLGYNMHPMENVPYRISYERADTILRAEDGLAGRTVYSPEIIAYQSFGEAEYAASLALAGEVVGQNGEAAEDLSLADVAGSISEVVIGYENDDLTKNMEALERRVGFLSRLPAVIEKVRGKIGSADARQAFLAETVDSFLQKQPKAEFDPVLPRSFVTLERFVGFYAGRLQELVATHNWPEEIDGYRQEFKAAVNSPRFNQLMRQPARRRAAYVAEATPVIIKDPLTSLLDKRSEEGEIFGSFDTMKRIVTVDPFSVDYAIGGGQAANESELSVVERVLSFKKTVFHELFHASTGTYYLYKEQLWTGDAADDISQEQLWPNYWNEAMTEKLASNALAVTVQKVDVPDTGFPVTDEGLLRRFTSLDPDEVAETQESLALREQIASAYPDERLLIDSMFQRLDWEAAGLTWQQAGDLAMYAFTEVPSPAGSPPDFQDRLAFITAVNQAAHHGFFIKFSTNVELYGEGLAMNMLVDPKFNPHDPEAVPVLAGRQQIKELLLTDWSAVVKKAVDRLGRSEELGAPGFILGAAQENLKFALRRAEEAELLLGAVKGLKAILRARHPRRMAPDEETMAQVVAGMSAGGLRVIQRPPIDMAPHERAIAAWREVNRPSNSTTA